MFKTVAAINFTNQNKVNVLTKWKVQNADNQSDANLIKLLSYQSSLPQKSSPFQS